ncbi:hypothetical protein MTR67_006048 [Solanum verrucosum]|uniref:Uncharacterized protein n=1 Tax=Solanum verrucosum TaxID=315347 RepID=A0AAF0PXK5_SOLVR|nr:hypothetical protein MTR67_006048 [Solanum verrucosum]
MLVRRRRQGVSCWFEGGCEDRRSLVFCRRSLMVQRKKDGEGENEAGVRRGAGHDGRTTYNSVSVSEDGTVTPLSLPPPTLYERHKIYVADSCRGMVYAFRLDCALNQWWCGTLLQGSSGLSMALITDRAPHPRNHITMRSNRVVSDLATGFTFLPISTEYKLVRVILYFNNTVYIRITRWNSMTTIFLPAKEMDMDMDAKLHHLILMMIMNYSSIRPACLAYVKFF